MDMDFEETELLLRAVEKWMYSTLSAMVDDEMAVMVLSKVTDAEIDLDVRVAKGDMGNVIGKQGRIARSLRTLLNARGGKDGVRYGCSIGERQHESLVDEVGFAGEGIAAMVEAVDAHDYGNISASVRECADEMAQNGKRMIEEIIEKGGAL